MKIVKHPLKCYFKHIFIILVASKHQTILIKSSLRVFLFQNRVNRMHPKIRSNNFLGLIRPETMFYLKSNLSLLVFNVWWGHTWCFGASLFRNVLTKQSLISTCIMHL